MENVIVHILTIGFHHKRGCEIEFIYPPLNENIKLKQLDIWKNLPSLALPDGAHKNDSDLINFFIPGPINSTHKVLFGVSYFKQVSAEMIKTKSMEVTRNTIQKSVVILATLPLFGAIGSLLSGITDNYFGIGDFEKTDILIESYDQLNKHFQLTLDDNRRKYNTIENIIVQDLSIINLIYRYEYDILTLIKIVLLRRKVLFLIEPLYKLTTTILSLVSLFPGVLESSSFQNSLDFLEVDDINQAIQCDELSTYLNSMGTGNHNGDVKCTKRSSIGDSKQSTDILELRRNKVIRGRTIQNRDVSVRCVGRDTCGISKSASFASIQDILNFPIPGNYDHLDNWRFSLEIFDRNNILLPYANIGMLDILENTGINSFVIGANNILWKLKSVKFDVIINEDIKNGGLELNQINNQTKSDDLGKLLQLTVLDRKFAKYLIQIVKSHLKSINTTCTMKSDTVNDISGIDVSIDVGEDPTVDKIQANGSTCNFCDSSELEEWLRQFLFDYIKAIMLSAAGLGTKKSFDDFGCNFLLGIQRQSFFKHWFDAIDHKTIVSEVGFIDQKVLYSSSQNLSTHKTGDNSKCRNAGKPHSIMNYDHPGRKIQPKVSNNIPGYYHFKENTDHRKSVINKSVNEMKRFAERKAQFKSSVSAGLSKFTSIQKVSGVKLGSTLWYNISDNDDQQTEGQL